MPHRIHVELVQRADQLIRLQATGRAKEFAHKLGISESTLFRLLQAMREHFRAPIYFSKDKNSYCYTESGQLKMEFSTI
ncbi:MAG: hypothetical protein ACKVOR_14580 [Flavobacteriales bacterium]